jgi:hypothetical protein
MGEALRRMSEKRYAYRFLIGKTERKMPLARHRRRWEDGIMQPGFILLGIWINGVFFEHGNKSLRSGVP